MAKKRSGNKLNGRKALQTLQPSVDDERTLVGKRGSVQLKFDIEKKLPLIPTNLVSKVDADKKSCQNMPDCEDSPKIARRSQRKRGEIVSSSALRENVIPKAVTATKNKNSKNENLLKATKIKSVKTKSKCVKENKSKSKKSAVKNDSLVQSMIEFPRLPSDQPDQSENVSISSDLAYLVTDDTPEHYWKEIAEQRQAALDETLKENELLQDQLTVLQAENDALLSFIESTREFLDVVNKTVGDSEDDV